jgi:cell division protein FtsW
MSIQKFGYLPEPMADSIFAVFAEETGFVGGLIVIALFLIIAWTGFRIAKNTKTNFEKLAALGIISWLSVQAVINIGAMLRILPLTGVPLPFMSYGGSALIAELTGVGILLNISKNTRI